MLRQNIQFLLWKMYPWSRSDEECSECDCVFLFLSSSCSYQLNSINCQQRASESRNTIKCHTPCGWVGSVPPVWPWLTWTVMFWRITVQRKLTVKDEGQLQAAISDEWDNLRTLSTLQARVSPSLSWRLTEKPPSSCRNIWSERHKSWRPNSCRYHTLI